MPKKSRRDRKRAPQQATSRVSSPATPETGATDIPEMQFTDFESAENATGDERGMFQHPQSEADDSIESVLERSAQAMQFQQNQMGSDTQFDGVGPTAPEVTRTLRRVQRKTPVATSPAPKKPQIAAVSLPPESAAVPMAQVPYVPSDLRRVAFSALVIIVVIIVGGILVTNAIH